jgi:hypothetical protein
VRPQSWQVHPSSCVADQAAPEVSPRRRTYN